MKSEEIRSKFLEFFRKRGHAILPSASLVPENDPSVLFNTAGMQPFVPYLLGQSHPLGKRLANVQKCVRTVDIDDIGDNTHATFFEMLGNWSLGDYFKKEAISWSYELLTSKTEGFGFDPKRLYVTVFEGDDDAPRDQEAVEIWKSVGMPENRIYFLPKKSNWWSAGNDGPCGPDSEMFYDVTPNGLGDLTHDEYLKADERRDVVEIWNDVFMEYQMKGGKVVGKLSSKNIDTGSGLERVTMISQGVNNIYETDLHIGTMNEIKANSTNYTEKSARIVADHVRASVFLISDGVLPSNSDQGYVLRKLIRRAVRHADNCGLPAKTLTKLAENYREIYKNIYKNIESEWGNIVNAINAEEDKFRQTLKDGLVYFKKMSANASNKIFTGKDAFILFSTYGFPLELTKELVNESGLTLDEVGFNENLKAHQEISRAGSEQKFKGGLAGTGEMETKYHTATHLLHQALRTVLGPHVSQKGSNITAERLRFDFTHTAKMTDEEKKKVEDLINAKIKESLPVNMVTLPKIEAEKTGALHFFGDKYGENVSVYYIGNSIDSAFSKEFCGGPHVTNIGNLGTFKIQKEEAVSAGVRRIKATLI